MKFKDGKTFSAYVRSKLHSGYITLLPPPVTAGVVTLSIAVAGNSNSTLV